MGNFYYDPAAFNLELVGEIDIADSYEFRKFVVWRNIDTERLLFATDSG